MSVPVPPTAEQAEAYGESLLDPVLFTENILHVSPWATQEAILRSVETRRRTAVKSCHSSGKTRIAACAILWWLARYEEATVVVTSASQLQIEKVIFAEIAALVAKADYPFPAPLLSELKFDSRRFAVGFATTAAEKDRGVRMQGFHSPNILIVCDEAIGIPPDIFSAIEGALASGNNRLLVLGNPTISSGYLYDCFHSKRDIFNCISISAFDTPNLEGLTLETLLALSDEELDIAPRSYLVGRRWVKERYQELGEEHPLYQSRVLGQFPKQSDDALISLTWLEAARDRKLSAPNAPTIAGVDVGGGGDGTETVLTVRKGPEILLQRWWPHYDAFPEVAAALTRYHEAGVLQAVHVDSIGVGHGMFCRLTERGFPTVPICVGDPPRDREKFFNLKAELYWALRLRFEEGDVSGLVDDKTLGQLAGLRYLHDSRGRVQVESKKDAVRRGCKSPDRAESLMLSFAAVGTGGGVYARALSSTAANDGIIFDAEALRALDPGVFNAGWYRSRAIACAFSLSMPLVALEICDSGKILWVVREFYFDNSRESHPLSSSEFYDHLIKFRAGLDPLTQVQHLRSNDRDAEVYLADTDECREFRTDCLRKGLPWTAVSMDADELVAATQRISALLDRKELRISSTCVNLIEQLRNYRFDVRKAAQQGREAPIEDGRSQCVSALRMYVKRLDLWR